jgi:rod shape determining protein RodA
MSERWRHLDRVMIGSVLALCAIGLLTVASATSQTGGTFVQRQVLWIGLGLMAAAAAMQIGYRRFLDWAVPLYLVSLGLLVLVLLLGQARLGAQRWLDLGLFSLQPSETARLALILVLARYFDGRPGVSDPWRGLAVPLALVAPLAGLVLIEPDLGSAAMIGIVGLAICVAAGVRWRWLGRMAAIGVALSPAVWLWGLREYQRQRLLVFLNPNHDPLGAGYTVIQSRIAVGSGGFWGKGWQAGTQNQLNFLPERHTDFIFSVIAEEWGFWGSLVVVWLFFLIVLRILQILRQTGDAAGQFVAVGVAVWLGLQAVINIAMTMGLVPVVGLPLPFVSYGGSSLVTAMIGIGLVLDVKARRTVF